MLHLKKSVLTLALFIFLNVSHSQELEYKPGYIVNLEKDTIRGYILPRISDARHESCKFKNIKTANPVTYSANHILGYGWSGGSRFEVKQININEPVGEIEATDFKPGFIINLKKDTIVGFIRKRGDSPYEFCNFKSSETAGTIRYSPFQILGYGDQNSFYLSKEAVENETSIQLFAEVLLFGRASLLEIKGEVYLGDSSKQILRLQDASTQDGMFEIRKEFYKGLLKLKLTGCDEIAPRIQTVKYDTRSLIKLLEFYNSCFNEKYEFQPPKLLEKDPDKPMTEPLFAAVLVSGKASLLRVSQHFYLEDSEGTIYILEKRITQTDTKTLTKDLYKGVLNWKLTDCSKVTTSKIQSLLLTEPALVKLFSSYNSCFR